MTVRELFEIGGIWAWLGLGLLVAILIVASKKNSKPHEGVSAPENNQAASAATGAAGVEIPLAVDGATAAVISIAVFEYRRENFKAITAAITAAVAEYRASASKLAN